MQHLTIQQALEQEDAANEWQPKIYIYHDGEVYFYIGISEQPYMRLQQHLGKGVYTPYPSAVGELIIHNKPHSLQWFMDVYTLQEIAPDIDSELLSPVFCRGIAERIEHELIKRHHPCLNIMKNTKAIPLPEKYRYRRIANEGVIITEEEEKK